MKSSSFQRTGWTRIFPPSAWLAEYKQSWLRHDAIAGVTLAAYAIPVSLAYAGLAGLPPQVGIYGYMLGGLGYALLGSSRQLAIGPTSAISLMIAGSVGALAGGDAIRFAQIASLSAFAVAVLCLIAWLLKLSILIRLVSDSILVGFKAGAGLTIIMSQLPSLFGVAGGGHNFFGRASGLQARSATSICPYWQLDSQRSCSCSWVNDFWRGGRSDWPWWRYLSSWQPCWAFLHWACLSPETSLRDCRLSRCPLSECWNSRSYFQ